MQCKLDMLAELREASIALGRSLDESTCDARYLLVLKTSNLRIPSFFTRTEILLSKVVASLGRQIHPMISNAHIRWIPLRRILIPLSHHVRRKCILWPGQRLCYAW